MVEMLNGLYLVFDSRIEQYNVYKVETVNETYMLASGRYLHSFAHSITNDSPVIFGRIHIGCITRNLTNKLGNLYCDGCVQS